VNPIAQRLADVRARIARAAEASGRRADDVRLVAVSKRHPPEAIRAAFAAGQRAFGENYAQELDAKAAALGGGDAPLAIEWHFIGHLQTNKAKIVARTAHVVQAVDGVAGGRELAKRVAREERGPVGVLVEVNIGGEATKHGVRPGELGGVLEAVRAERALTLRGLMTMPPAGDLDVARRVFDALRTLRSQHGGESALPELSMGMSDDLEVAIACGATMVRVGTAIFGARE
jgi:pyridoxal phosphate enzyme (YggS family)